MTRKYNKKFAAKKVTKLDEPDFAQNAKNNTNKQTKSGSDDFSSELIKALNKEAGSQIAFNLGTDDAPTNVKRWISTGSRQLDAILSNRLDGGFPEGRVVEIQGPSSSGKSHIAILVAKNTQKLGGVCVYIDSENATNLDNLVALGVDVNSKFIFVQTSCTEEIFTVAENTIIKARAMQKDVPVTIIWDSVAASSPKAELEGDYDQNTIGLQARVLGKGMRKITNIIGNQKVLFLLIQQQRQMIGVSYGDPLTTPGGNAIPYAASVRLRITSTGQSKIEDSKGNIIGIKVKAKTIKNKVAKPFRECEFQILFGVGIKEHEEVFDLFREYCSSSKEKGIIMPNGHKVSIEGAGAWKNFLVHDKDGEVIEDIKFNKSAFGEKVLYKPEYSIYMEALFEATLIMKSPTAENLTYVGPDLDSAEEAMELIRSSEEEKRQVLNG